MKAILFALLGGMCWGVGEFFTKQVLLSGKIGPWAVVMVRIVAVVPLALLAYWIATSLLKSEPRAFWQAPTPILTKLLLGSALMAGFGGVAFFYLGLKFGDISVVKPIALGVSPVVGAFLGWYVLKESMPPLKVAGIALMIAGLVMVAVSGRGGHHAPKVADPAMTTSGATR
jgi:drug/metabolite transporter (DMT)-like permease